MLEMNKFYAAVLVITVGQKNNLRDWFKLKLIIIYHIWFIMKILYT